PCTRVALPLLSKFDHFQKSENNYTLMSFILILPDVMLFSVFVSEKCKARGFTVIVDGRKSQWEHHVIPAEVSLVCVVKPDEFWDKKVTHFCFWKEKDRLGFEVILVSANKLTRYIEPCQLTDDFGGSLDYDHSDWLNKRLVCFEKFTKESTSLLDELSIINETDKSSGHELLSELQQRRFNGSEGGGGQGAWCPMEEELLAQPQVMKLLDSLREQYTRYQELCRQRNKRTQLDEIHAKVMQVVTWLQGPGSELLKTQQAIGDSMRTAQALQQKHEEIESQHSEWFAVYVELNQQIAALLSQQLSDVCYRQAAQLESRQNVLQAAVCVCVCVGVCAYVRNYHISHTCVLFLTLM
uniref:SEC14 and spectrin domains 1 n=1 Tax=Sphaeramia orbicularis TaxID=375764 RepID=A0A672ZG67_9TELE